MALSQDTQDLAPLPHTTILLVDDEESLLQIMSTVLADAGHRCLRATKASLALEQLAADPTIDVVVSDIRMPEMDGISLLKAIRGRFGDRHWLQVLFVTAHASLDVAVEALRLDAVDFLHKPVRRQELLEAVDRALVRARSHRSNAMRWQEGLSQFEHLSEEVKRVAEMLRSPLAQVPPSQPEPAADEGAAEVDAGRQRRERLFEIIRARELREKIFGDELFADPVWHMLLYLMERKLHGQAVYLTSLYVASGVPISTASRRLDELERAGFVRRFNDPEDRRRQIVELMPESVARLNTYFESLDRKAR